MDGSARQHVDLEDPIPVHIVYWTAYVDDNGTVQFRADLYERLDGSTT